MGFRFRKRVKLLPGVHINLSGSRKGINASAGLGVPGANVNLGRKGLRSTVGIPGTGISHVQENPWRKAEAPTVASPSIARHSAVPQTGPAAQPTDEATPSRLRWFIGAAVAAGLLLLAIT